jgi:hypothetical protein
LGSYHHAHPFSFVANCTKRCKFFSLSSISIHHCCCHPLLKLLAIITTITHWPFAKKKEKKGYNIVQLKYETKFQRKTIIYIYKKNTYSWNHKIKKKSTFFGAHISLVFFHTCLKYILISKFSNFFQNPTTSKENLLFEFFYDKHKKNGSNPQDVPTTHGSSSSYFKFLHLILFPHFYLQSQPTNSPFKIIFNIFLNSWKYFSPTHLIEKNVTNYTKIKKIIFKHFYTYY